MKGTPLTTAWEGLKVLLTKDVRSINFPEQSTQNWCPGVVQRYSEDEFTQYNADTKVNDTGRLLVRFPYHSVNCLFSNLDGFSYICL